MKLRRSQLYLYFVSRNNNVYIIVIYFINNINVYGNL